MAVASCLARERPYELHEKEGRVLTCSAHGKHPTEGFRFFLFISYSFSFNQTGVLKSARAAEDCFTVEHFGAQTMSDQYFHFTKHFFFGIFLQHCFTQKQRDLHMDVPNSPLDHLMFEYKQTILSRISELPARHLSP